MDSGQSNFSDANFSAIFLYQLSEKLYVESELEIATGGGSVELGLEHANLIWLIGNDIAFHAGRFVPHFGMYRGRLAEGFMNRFATNPIGFGDGGIGTMEAVGFGFQGGFAAGTSKLNYDLWVSDGPQLIKDVIDAGQFDYEAYTDNNKNKAIGGRIGFLPFSNSCLEIGASYENAKNTLDQAISVDTLGRKINVGVRAMAFDANFYHKIDPLNSTLRITGEYKKQDVDDYNYTDENGGNYTFKNSANTYYGMVSLRPTGSDNEILRNFEIAFRYSKFTTPDHTDNPAIIPWGGYFDKDNVHHSTQTRTAVALNYWLKWNCVAKLCYQKQDGVTNQYFVELYYGF